MQFDIDGARKEGYSDAEIAGYLAARSRFDLTGARAEGYSDAEIIGFLTKRGGTPKPGGAPLAGTMDAELEAVKPAEPAEEPSAQWGDVVRSLPGQFVAGTRGAAANLRRMTAEESIAQREEALEPAQFDPSGWGALVKPSAVARQRARLESDRAGLQRAEADAAQARKDMQLVTPENQTIAQEALSSLAQSGGPTLIGLAAGILTRNVPLALAIAGGGGAAQQAGATYGEAREHGADHRKASVAASIDAVLEGAGEALPLGYALKAGTPVFKRIFGTLAREAGQEAATQFAQDLRAMSMENPELTFNEVWRNVRVAALAGVGGGAVYGGAGAAVNWSRQREDARTAVAVQRIGQADSADEAIAAAAAASAEDTERANIAAAIASAQEALEAEELGRASPLEADAVDPTQRAGEFDELQLRLAAAHSTDASLREASGAELARRTEGDAAGISRAVRARAREASEAGSDAFPQGGEALDAAAHEAASSPLNDLPEPSEAQLVAGNYRKGHLRIGGLDISVENPEGSQRSGTDANGKAWSVTMASHYGYVKGTGTVGFDKDHVDVFVKPSTPEDWHGTVYVVNQNKANGHFDEVKAMVGWESEAEARAAYLANYEAGWEKRIRSIVPMPVEQFKAWVTDPSKHGPAGGEARPVAIGGSPIEALDDRRLELVAKAGRPAAKVAAKAELQRRAAGGRASAEPLAAPRSGTGTQTAPAQPARALEPAGTILGRSPAELSDQALRVAERGGSPAVREAAADELRRRAPSVAPRSPKPALQATEGKEGSGRDTRSGASMPPTIPPRDQKTDSADATDEQGAREAVGIAMTPPYSPAAAAPAAAGSLRARPDAIRQAIRDLFDVPLNEGRFGRSRDALGIYKVKPRTIRVKNQNDIGVIAHELGHHLSETSRPIRAARQAFDGELRQITPYAAQQTSAALQREEGMAEFVRFYLMEPAQAKAKAPGFFGAFEDYVKANGLKPAIDELAGAIRDWQNLPPADRILAKVGEAEPDFRKRVNLDRIVFEVFDRWLPLKNMVADLDPSVAPSADPFKLAHLLAGDAAVIEDWLLRETIPFNFERRANLNDRGKPLAEILKPVMYQQREFGAYLIAKRANELMRRGKEHLYSQDEIAAGLRLETPEFKAAAKALYRYQDQLLDYAVEGGLLTAGAARAFRQHPFYVPFFRVGERLGQRGGSVFKEIRGGTDNLRDPIANIIENTVRVIHATNRNFVLAKAHDLARRVPGGGRWLEDVPMPERAVKLETEKIIEQLREQGVEISTEAAEALATVQTFFVKNPFGDDQDRVIVIRRSGHPYALQVNDEMLWRALERFEPVDMGFLEKLLAVPADVLRAGIVLSPEFMARNVARDMLSGFIQSKAGILPVAGTVNGFKEVATRSDAARLYRAFGGAYGDMWRADSGLERALVERMARRGGFDPATIVTPRGLIALLHRLGSITEAGTRVAEFKKSMDEGTVDELIDAAYNAREVSVDFGMHGHSRAIRFLTRITPFLNPALQGWYKAARTSKDRPFSTVLRGGMLAAASVLLYLNNRDEDWFDEIEQWERNTYWHLDVGLRDPSGQVIPLRIPKPFEWGAFFGSIPEALAQVAVDQHGKRLAKRLESIVDDVFMLRVVPTALLVPTELWANKNQFTGRPIVPAHRERLAAELQVGPGTSLAARKVGELTEASPAKLDHAVRGFFGTLGTYTVMLADQALRASGEDPAALPLPWQRTPVARVFFHDPSGANSRHVTEFYELLKEARRADASLKYLEPERMAEYYAKNREAIEHRRSADKVAKAMADLRRDNEQLRKSRDLPDMERASMIIENNRQIRWLARDFMKDAQPAR